MKSASNIKIKDLVLVGGGHSHAMALKMLGMEPIPGVQITLIARDIDTPYSGMLPGYIEGIYTKDECYIDLNRLCRFADARLLHCSACKLDTVHKVRYARSL
jgi:selenide, water dikinase